MIKEAAGYSKGKKAKISLFFPNSTMLQVFAFGVFIIIFG